MGKSHERRDMCFIYLPTTLATVKPTMRRVGDVSGKEKGT
jgi:hypothetical protein